MTVTLTKKKAALKSQSKATNVIDEVVKRYAANRLTLEAKLAKLAALQKEVAADEKELLEYTDLLVKADEPAVLTAGNYVVKIGPKGRKVVAVDNAFIKGVIGDELFDQLATFQIGDLNKYLTGEQVEAAVSYQHANKRKVTIEEADQA